VLSGRRRAAEVAYLRSVDSVASTEVVYDVPASGRVVKEETVTAEILETAKNS
jgi:hypothetical protein